MTVTNSDEIDKAGKQYWDETWKASDLPPVWRVDSLQIRDYPERKLFDYIRQQLAEHGVDKAGYSIVEVGCARSAVLPLFGLKLGMQVYGVDYSEIGCEQARAVLARENVQGEVFTCDVFSVPDYLKERFDVVVSFGLVEHFKDTTAVLTALAGLLKPGGIIITNIPNMTGLVGKIQRLLDRDVYDIHVPLSREQLESSHNLAGFQIQHCMYFLASNFGVCNINSIRPGTLRWWVKKITLAILARVSMTVWLLERWGCTIRPGRFFSPSINCVAVKPHRTES